MFHPHLINTAPSQIVAAIKNNGYFAFNEALDASFVDNLLNEIDFKTTLLNTNDVGVVMTENNKYLTHCLANSHKAYDVITAPKVLDICKEYFSNDFKLNNHRIYQTSGMQHMPWHTDNNKQNGAEFSGKHLMPGLLFLFYLSDVDKNAFQFVRESQKYSRKYINERYLSDGYVSRTYKNDIVSFKLKKGSVIICDIHGIHRAEPFKDRDYTRTSLLFQVDEVGNDNAGHGEKNIVNTEYLENVTPAIMNYLGFGFKRSYPAFPNSSIATMTAGDIIALQKQLFPKTLRAVYKKVLKAILPSGAINTAKRLKWRIQSKP